MDQIKIGKFIQEKRKAKNLTQLDLADKLLITDRAVSKWECGKSLPDASIMLQLCELLEISVNELLTGEDIEMENYNKQAELNLVKITKQNELANKRLLLMEVVIMIVSVVFLLSLLTIGIIIATNDKSKSWAFFTLLGVGLVQFLVCAFISVRIEQTAGYYECSSCHKTFNPTYWQVNLARHIGRKRKMKCPHCGKKVWCFKTLSEKNDEK